MKLWALYKWNLFLIRQNDNFSSNFIFITPTFKFLFKILIVDDDQINIMVLTKYMESFNDCEFETAFQGKQAVDIVKNNAARGLFFDVILMDCNMPVMDGFQASRIIQ